MSQEAIEEAAMVAAEEVRVWKRRYEPVVSRGGKGVAERGGEG
jgi:hypothetical protein